MATSRILPFNSLRYSVGFTDVRIFLFYSLGANLQKKTDTKKKLSDYLFIFASLKLSIIIPVYQVEQTLRRCIDSVLSQSFTDWEMILVDDGSPDGCPDICDEYSKNYGKIIVIHKENGGLSDARNAGIQIAKGEYITFIDSDDYLGEETLAKVMPIMDKHPEYDMLEYPVFEHFSLLKKEHHLTFENREYRDMRSYWLDAKAYCHTYAWNKIYRKSLFASIKFPYGKLFEDAYTLPLLLNEAKVVATTDQGMYFYTHNDAGITVNADGKALAGLLEAHLKVLPEMADAEYYAHVLNIQLDVFELTGDEPIIPILPYRSTWKLKLLHLIGIKRLCKLNKTLHSLMRRKR